MKRFKEFINENNVTKNDYIDFIEEIKNYIISDFDMSVQQTNIFLEQNEDILKQLFEDGVSPKDAIVTIKLP